MKKADLVYQDDNYLIYNKASGLLSTKDSAGRHKNVAGIAEQEFGEIHIVHKLEKDISGCLLLARNKDAQYHAVKLFENNALKQVYLGIVHGTPREKEDTIDKKIGPALRTKMAVHSAGKDAVTSYKLEESFGKFSLLSFELKFHRTHQIRTHMEFLGHPVLGDEIYGGHENFMLSSIKRRYNLALDEERERPLLKRVALHSSKIQFQDAQGKDISCTAPLYKDMKASLQQMRKILGKK